jgi:hypothetical protein
MNLLYAIKALRDIHSVKLGTMEESGKPNVSIPEGFFEAEYRVPCKNSRFGAAEAEGLSKTNGLDTKPAPPRSGAQ